MGSIRRAGVYKSYYKVPPDELRVQHLDSSRLGKSAIKWELLDASFSVKHMDWMVLILWHIFDACDVSPTKIVEEKEILVMLLGLG